MDERLVYLFSVFPPTVFIFRFSFFIFLFNIESLRDPDQEDKYRISAFPKPSQAHNMAPLVQWAIQMLSGSLYTKDSVSSCGTPWQVTPQAKDNAATSAVGSFDLAVTSTRPGQIDVYAGPFGDGSIGHKYGYWDSWVPGLDDGTVDGYEHLAGSIKGPPLALSWSPNPNDVFAVGRDDHLWHKALTTDWTWTEWRDLGGSLSSNYRLTAAGSESRLDVFGIREENGGTKSLWRQSWNGSSWQPGLQQLKGRYSTAPSVISRVPGELSLFIVDVDKNLLHRHYRYSDRQWSTWDTIGTGFRTAPAAFAITPDRLDVFGVKDDGAVYHRAWVRTKQRWLEWENLGGEFGEIVSVERFTPDSLVLVGRKADRTYEGRFYGWNGSANESAWDSLGGIFNSQPALASTRHNDINVLGIGWGGYLSYQNFIGESEKWYPGRGRWKVLADRPRD